MTLPLITPVRALILAWSGGGKTGALASLANAGFKLRILDFDGKQGTPLAQYVKPECRGNVDVMTLVDKLRGGLRNIEVSGIPVAFADGLKAMDHWKRPATEGEEEVDLGRSKDWGQDTVVVLDTGTAMGRAAFRRVIALNNRTPLNTRDSDWGGAMAEEGAFLERLCSPMNKHHVIVNYHLKWLGPREERKGDTDAVKEIKAKEADLISTRLYPSAMGSKNAPQGVGQYFQTTVLIEPKFGPGSKVRRMIYAEPRPELDLKLAATIAGPLPIETGLLTIFNALLPGVVESLGARPRLTVDEAVEVARMAAGGKAPTLAKEEGRER